MARKYCGTDCIRGETNRASMTAAVIGIACGAGQWPLVLIGAVISIVMLTLLRIVERRYFPDDDATS